MSRETKKMTEEERIKWIRLALITRELGAIAAAMASGWADTHKKPIPNRAFAEALFKRTVLRLQSETNTTDTYEAEIERAIIEKLNRPKQ